MIGTEIAFTGPDGVPCVGVVYIVGKGRRSGGFVAKVTKSEAPRLIGKAENRIPPRPLIAPDPANSRKTAKSALFRWPNVHSDRHQHRQPPRYTPSKPYIQGYRGAAPAPCIDRHSAKPIF